MHPDLLAHKLGRKKQFSTFVFDDLRSAAKMSVSYPKSVISRSKTGYVVSVEHNDPMEQLALKMEGEPQLGIMVFTFPSAAIANMFVSKFDSELYLVNIIEETVSFRRIK